MRPKPTCNKEIRVDINIKYDGEKHIDIKCEDKAIILVGDFLMDLVQFFRNPFWYPHQDFEIIPTKNYNNYPSMTVELCFENCSIILAQDFEKKERNDCLVIISDIHFSQKYFADCWMGPGSLLKDINVK